MPVTGDGSPSRPKTPARRMLVGVARVAAFLSIITGVGALLAPDWVRDPVFYGGAGVVAIALTAALSRKKEKPAAIEWSAAEPVALVDAGETPAARPARTPDAPTPDVPKFDLDAIVEKVREEERSRWSGEVSRSIDSVRRIREELSTAEFARDEAEQHAVVLREQVQQAARQVEEQRSASNEKIMHADTLVAQLNRELADAQTKLQNLEIEYNEKLQKVVDGLGADHDREIAGATSQRDDAVRRVADLERVLHEERIAREALQRAHDEHQSGRQDLAARLETERTSHAQVARERDRERSARTEIERAAETATAEIAKLQEKIKDLKAAFDGQRESLTARIAELQRESTRIPELEGVIEETKAAQLRIEAESSERVVELSRAAEEEKIAREQAEAEWNEKLQTVVAGLKADHETDIGAAIMDREAAKAEVRSLTQKVEEMQRAVEDEKASRARLESELHQRLQTETSAAAQRIAHLEGVAAEEKTARERVESEWNEKLQKIVAGMAADHENDIGTAMIEREGAKAEVRSLTQKIEELKRAAEHEKAARVQLEEEVQQRLQAESARAAQRIAELENLAGEEKTARERVEAEWSEKLQKIVAGMAADHENDIGNAMVQREEAKAELRSLSQKLEELKRAAEHEKAARERIEAEWSEKLQKIVAGMAADHENDIGEATMEREAARAEARHLTIKLQELQRDLDAERAKPVAAVDESALRAKLDAEWSEKLQTIVNHLASDHEADIGKALEEKEEAKAAARTFEQRVATMERAMSMAEQKFKEMRDALVAKTEAAQREVAEMKKKPAPPVALAPTQDLPLPSPDLRQELADPFPQTVVPTPAPFPSPFASSSIDEQRARAEVLDFAEQANAALRRTGPGTIPMPAVAREGRRSMILFVHHDPNMRTMWRDQLHKSGYDVITAADGLEGLRLATAHKPDVVIADAQMPKMDGRALCQMLKSNAETSAVKVVLMSGMYTAEVPLESGEATFPPDEMLRKPVKLDALQTALANVLAT